MTQAPYDIAVRRNRRGGQGVWPKYVWHNLDDLEAAGIVAAGERVEVCAVFAAREDDNLPGEVAGAIWAEVYAYDPVAAVRWESSDLTWAEARDTGGMQRVLARAQRIADLANALAHGEDPGTLLSGDARDAMTPCFPHVDEDDKGALLAERSRLISALGTIEEALREKHGSQYRTV